MEPNASSSDVAKDLQGDLVRKYKTHRSKIETFWRSFDKKQRTKCLKAGAADGVVLKHPLDWSLGDAYKLMPEWNLRDIAEPGSDHLLDLIKHRATKALFEQYREGVNGGPGDHAFIAEMMATKGLRSANASLYKDCWTFFLDDEKYGDSVRLLKDKEASLAAFAPAIRARLCVPQATAELILLRQNTLLQLMNVIIEDILDIGSQTRARKEQPKKPEKAATAALSKLSLQAPQVKLTLPQVIASARDQKDALEEYLGLISEEPVVLAHVVNVWFFSRPELIADEKGRRLPVHTDKYISGAFFDAIHNAIQGAAIWKYIARLLEMLEQSSDKAHRAILLQELSNISHFEYGRTQALVKRHVQTGTGQKWFKRASNGLDKAGNARVTMKGNPEELTRSDPQLHYLLRLCQPETNASKAVDWAKKLSDLYEGFPEEREKVEGREAEAFCDLTIIVAFIQDLSSVASVPSLSRKKGQQFITRSQELEAELNEVKKQVDLREYAAPIDNLLEPGMAERALKSLDEYVVEKVGTKMGSLYHDLIEECCASLQQQIQQAKAKPDGKTETDWSQSASTSKPEERVELRRQKEKTRPVHSSAFDILPPADKATLEEPTVSAQTFNVSTSTAEVFSTLFTKSKARGSVNWTAFEAAMAELGFSVIPKFGSVYTFLPPDSMAVKRPLTLHRPHTSRIEGYLTMIFARRLGRVYGFREETFRVE